MLSRIADSLFWLNRYTERARCILLASRTHYIYSLDKQKDGSSWKPILQLYTELNAEELEEYAENTPSVLQYLLINQSNKNSIRSIVLLARENARGVQDHISREIWEEINSFYHRTNLRNIAFNLQSPDALEVVEQFLKHSMFFTGVADITMQRGTGWSIMKLGKFLERCLATLLITDKQCELFNYELDKEQDITRWRFLLLSLTGYEAYLKTYRSTKHNHNVLHQVIFNTDFPHSVLYCMAQIERALNSLITDNENPEIVDLMRTFGRIYSRIKYTDPQDLITMDSKQFFMQSKLDLQVLNQKLASIFFSY